MKYKTYFNRSQVMLQAEQQFILAINQADQALAMFDYFDCMSEVLEPEETAALKELYEEIFNCHIHTAMAIVNILWGFNEMPVEDVRKVIQMLVWFNFPEDLYE